MPEKEIPPGKCLVTQHSSTGEQTRDYNPDLRIIAIHEDGTMEVICQGEDFSEKEFIEKMSLRKSGKERPIIP
jgi:hypothetical protein